MHKEYFETTHDFELNPNSISRVTEYKINNAKANNGLVVYIPGFGGDLGGYTDSFCKKVAEKYPNFALMAVDYFCMKSRPSVGAEIVFEHEDRLKVNMGSVANDQIVPLLMEKYKNVKQQIFISAGLNPPHGEYQNFGIMAAIDIINACNHAIAKYDLDADNILLVGSSYGGYIANLVTKIAPGFVRAVFDNSSWANLNYRYVTGREILLHEFAMPLSDKLCLGLFVKSPWTLKSGMPNSLEKEKLAIRQFDYSELQKMKAHGGDSTCYLFYHAMGDKIANTEQKMDMARNMIQLGFMVGMEVFEQQDVDGEFIKSLDHGMGLSLVQFFQRGIAFLEDVDKPFKQNDKKIFNYSYADRKYTFDLNCSPLKATLITEL